MSKLIGVVGAGTMGAGIAQLGCLRGYTVCLFDPDPAALERASKRIQRDLRRGAERGRWSGTDALAATMNLRTLNSLVGLARCPFLIEAAPEDLGLKRTLLADLEEITGADGIVATNTSSLSVDEIAAMSSKPERFCGMHFFNPPSRMQLVEIVAGRRTGPATTDAAAALAAALGRTPIHCADSPGFIVNRCNRPYYLEALRIVEAGLADYHTIDATMRDSGFPMGPFELMDLIGIDVNLKIARTFYRHRPLERWRPHPIAERMVAAGQLGRKSGRGYYSYDDDGTPAVRDEAASESSPGQTRAVRDRILSQIINESCYLVGEGVAEPDDIDHAMKLGLNHPRGPFEWLAEIGPEHIETQLKALNVVHEGIYEPAPYLRELVTEPSA